MGDAIMSTDTNIQLATVSALQAVQAGVRVTKNTNNIQTQEVTNPALQEIIGGKMLPSNAGFASEEKIQEDSLSPEDVSQAIQNLNDYAQNIQRQLQFSVDEDTGRTVIKVLDSETMETIRQIPSEEIMNLARALHKFAEDKGRIFQTTV